MWNIEESFNNLNKNKISKNTLKKYTVYSLWKGNELVYIGRSINIIPRVTKHLETKDFDEFSYIECDSEEEMIYIESNLIIKLNPKYNKSLAGSTFTSLKNIRKLIQGIGDSYKYNNNYYVRKIKKRLEENNFKIHKFNNTDYIENSQVDNALKVILGDD